MELINVFRQAGIAALLSMFVAIFPVGAGLAYLLWPNEQRLGDFSALRIPICSSSK